MNFHVPLRISYGLHEELPTKWLNKILRDNIFFYGNDSLIGS